MRADPPPVRASLGLMLTLVLALAAVATVAQDRLAFPLVLEDPVGGGEVRLQPGGRALHLVFFATWCPPCVDELPKLADIEARWGDRGYRLVLVAVPTRQTRERLAQLVARQSPPGSVLFDASGAVGRACGVADLPAHVVVDGSGRVVYRGGALGPEVEQAIAGLVRPSRPGE